MAPRRAWLLVVLLLSGCASATPGWAVGRLEQVGAQEFTTLAQQKGGLILDVRTAGHVARGNLPNVSVTDVADRCFERWRQSGELPREVIEAVRGKP